MNPFTPKVLAVLRREFMQRVKTKWFLISTLGLPVLMLGLMLLAGVLISSAIDAEETVSIGVIDPSGEVTGYLVEELLADSILAAGLPELDGADDARLASFLGDSTYDLLFVLPSDILEGTEDDARLLAMDAVLPTTESNVRNGLRRALLRTRLAQSGLENIDAEALLKTARVEVVNISPDGSAGSQDVFRAISFGIAFLFYFVLLIYGQMIIRSIIEEKQSNIVEVIVSSLRPWELMLGKIVGVGAVGIAQIGVWVIVVLIATMLGLTAASGQLAAIGVDLSAIAIPWGKISLVLSFLILGYLLYAGMFAAAGATISSEAEAQQASMPVTMLIIIPFIAVQGVVTSPNALWGVVMSIIPFFSPLVMTSRVFVTDVPVWQLALSLTLLGATVLAAAWVAGRIYRVGVLMKGQRANLPEVIRWVRHG